MKKKVVCLMLALLMSASAIISCSDSGTNEESQNNITPSNPDTSGDTTPADADADAVPPDPFAEGFNYEGRSFTVQNSINQATTSLATSNIYIEGPEELIGDAAPDAAYNRNLRVQDKLNVKIEYTNVDYKYDVVATNTRNLINTGDSSYMMLINDIYGLIPLTVEGMFHNTLNVKDSYLDFNQPYWYDDFMSDISINSNVRYMLAGDYFIDILRTSHLLLMNKDLYTDLYGDPNEIYEMVLNNEWTLDTMIAMIEGSYSDLNGNGTVDKDDMFGLVNFEIWGPSIPFTVSADPGFIERDEEGFPVITIANERAVSYMEKFFKICTTRGSGVGKVGDENGTLTHFTSGKSLFVGYQRLGSLENEVFRTTEFDLAVLPYPKLDDAQEEYVTSAHDTSEVGLIPAIIPEADISFISAVVESLCRDTYYDVLPEYYENSLKFKYVRDDVSGYMIDIIHDHLNNGFALAYSNPLDGILLNKFSVCATNGNTNIISEINKSLKLANKLLEKWKKFAVEEMLK